MEFLGIQLVFEHIQERCLATSPAVLQSNGQGRVGSLQNVAQVRFEDVKNQVVLRRLVVAHESALFCWHDDVSPLSF